MNQVAIIESDSVVVSMKRASAALAEAVTISQTKKIVDVAAAAEIYAKRQHLSEEAEQMAVAVKVEALRKLGEMLKVAPKATGAKGIGKSAVPKENRTLAELGLTKKESAVAQKLASLPEKDFAQVRDGHVTVAKAIAAVDATKGKPFSAPAPEPANDPQPWDDEGAPSLEELMESERAEELEAAAMRRIFEADDHLAEALAMVKQKDALIEQLQWRINGLVGENAVLIREVKSLRRRVEKERAA
jgi:hypothetical protein